ncbi:MAG: ABC transporter permease subunit [Clostridia bacterium]|nr:ABC transporter permease subunit [Clostridia bacterium]
MKKFIKDRKLNIIFSLVAVVAMWLVWIIAYYTVENDYIIPSFTNTIKSMGGLFISSSFWTAFGYSLLRTAESFVISFVAAALLAVCAICSKAAAAFIRPIMAVIRTLPTMAVIIMLLVWTNAKIAPVIVTILVLFPMIYAQIMAAYGDIDKNLLQMAQVYKVSAKDKIFKIYIPLVSPNILAQSGANISLGIKVMVSSEIMASTYKSLGGLMQSARFYVDIPRLAALTILTVVVGLIFDVCFSQLAHITDKWTKGKGGGV